MEVDITVIAERMVSHLMRSEAAPYGAAQQGDAP